MIELEQTYFLIKVSTKCLMFCWGGGGGAADSIAYYLFIAINRILASLKIPLIWVFEQNERPYTIKLFFGFRDLKMHISDDNLKQIFSRTLLFL